MYLKIFFSVTSKWTGDWNDSLSLPLRSLWCCSSSTHSTPSVTSWWSLLTTWSRSAPGSSSPTWTATSCTPSSSSEWTTARPGWGDTSVSDVCPTLGPYIPYIRPTQPNPRPLPPLLWERCTLFVWPQQTDWTGRTSRRQRSLTMGNVHFSKLFLQLEDI